MTIAVDFDGTIVDHAFPGIGKLKDGVKEALSFMRAHGHKIIIWSCRSNRDTKHHLWYTRDKVFDEMVRFLNANSIPYDYVDDGSQGKVPADIYIDDRAIRFTNWGEVLANVESGSKTDPCNFEEGDKQ